MNGRTAGGFVATVGALWIGVGACTVDVPSEVCTALGDPAALSDGFRVPRIDLLADEEGRFSLVPRPDTVYSTCATFRCPPCFSDLGGGTRVDTELFASRRVIANWDQCVVGFAHIVAEEPQFSLEELNTAPDDAVCDVGGNVDVARWVGCWVYGPVGITEATDLRTLEPEPALRRDCSDDSEPDRAPVGGWAGCRTEDAGVGVCVGEGCEPVCGS